MSRALKFQFLVKLSESARLDLDMAELVLKDGQLEIADRLIEDARVKRELVDELLEKLMGAFCKIPKV